MHQESAVMNAPDQSSSSSLQQPTHRRSDLSSQPHVYRSLSTRTVCRSVKGSSFIAAAGQRRGSPTSHQEAIRRRSSKKTAPHRVRRQHVVASEESHLIPRQERAYRHRCVLTSRGVVVVLPRHHVSGTSESRTSRSCGLRGSSWLLISRWSRSQEQPE